jgi:hypothetical protein
MKLAVKLKVIMLLKAKGPVRGKFSKTTVNRDFRLVLGQYIIILLYWCRCI